VVLLLPLGCVLLLVAISIFLLLVAISIIDTLFHFVISYSKVALIRLLAETAPACRKPLLRLQRSRKSLLIETYAFRKFGVASTEVDLDLN
jgi:hypothetical protein